MILLTGLRIGLCESGDAPKHALAEALLAAKASESDLSSWSLRRLSIDARRGDITQVCSVSLSFSDVSLEQKVLARCPGARTVTQTKPDVQAGPGVLKRRPVVAGFGPAGMFAALFLAERGYRPLVLERGKEVGERAVDVRRYFDTGVLDPESNVQFGEGGAGTFSDGKLSSGIGDPLCAFVLETLRRFGAPQDILWRAKPHIGSDLLADIVRSIRREILSLGGDIRFGTKLSGIRLSGGAVSAAVTEGERIDTETLLLCVGHSARDTFAMLRDLGVRLSAKPFSAGVRIEHLQADIDRALYREHAGNPLLPKGEYALSAKIGQGGVYTFCMCPGGAVVAAASQPGTLVTNGMSEHSRSGRNANSALVAGVSFPDPFEGIAFQEKLERAAFAAASRPARPGAGCPGIPRGEKVAQNIACDPHLSVRGRVRRPRCAARK